MTRRPRLARVVPAALRGVLALALVWAASLAPGVMPARAADGGLVLEFCTSDGVVLMTVDADGRAVPSDDGPGDRHADRHAVPCAFAAAHVAGSPVQPLLWALPDGTAVGPVVPLAPPAFDPLRLARADHLPRGPPPAV